MVERAVMVAGLAANDELGLAALEFSKFSYPDLDVSAVLSWFDRAAGAVHGSNHLALRRVIAISEGLGGNVEDYYNPDNSFIHRVIDTRRGIPISLSVIWIEVGRRAGVDVQGVGLPGHFLVYAGGQLVDPFHYGEAIGFDEAAALAGPALGGSARLDPSWLEPVPTTQIVARMLRNLERVYLEAGDSGSLAWVAACLEAVALVDRRRR
jgi:regulator of sirC expression with transglutaminase-like and TPR domain